jgi:hypothetical protein
VQQHGLRKRGVPRAAQVVAADAEYASFVADRTHHSDESRRRIGAQYIQSVLFEIRRVHAGALPISSTRTDPTVSAN